MDGAVSAVGLKRGVWSAYHELYILEGRQERWAMSVSEDKIEEGENPLLLVDKSLLTEAEACRNCVQQAVFMR